MGNIKSQNQEILEWLKRGHTITPLEALERFGCFRLGGRIYDLKHGIYDGTEYPIITDTVERNGKRYASYRLPAQQRLF